MMNRDTYRRFVDAHRAEIDAQAAALANFDPTSLGFMKIQLVQAINIRLRMPVVPMTELTKLLVNFFAVQEIEDR
ncbi:MAG TPA: hypothetical protein PKM65_02160 [Spirochaetota bacterium]|nr:hypothetical protein [Spirochaetota bacterium]HNT12655.1 hypothetical protein [Spirochaetota bacterium]HNV47791.1 hypothetical protein [Spirochaetota bacterium]HOS39974.1 hypothetical protein [Spirochaetota bacterium]HPI22192.1 hypothetical protein [Spirochaetota bacterium]